MTGSPSTRRCPHCGAELRPLMVPLPLSDERMQVGWEPCGCPGAAAERAERERSERAARERDEEARLDAACERAGVPRRYLRAEHRDAEAVARGAYVFGPVGAGKTHLACAAVRRALAAGGTARVTSTVRLLADVRSAYGAEAAVLDSLAGCGLLVIDDLGKETPTAWTLSRLFRVVDDRYAGMRPMVVTSQLSLPDLAERLAGSGDEETARAIASRLAEACPRVRLDGPDRRLHGQG